MKYWWIWFMCKYESWVTMNYMWIWIMGEYDLCVNMNHGWIWIMGGGTDKHTHTSVPWLGLAWGRKNLVWGVYLYFFLLARGCSPWSWMAQQTYTQHTYTQQTTDGHHNLLFELALGRIQGKVWYSLIAIYIIILLGQWTYMPINSILLMKELPSVCKQI